MILKQKINIIEKYSGKSKFEFWSKIEVGDTLEVLMEFANASHPRGGMYVPDITCYNSSKVMKFTDKYNKISNYLSKLKYTEIW